CTQPVTTSLPLSHTCSCGYGCSVSRLLVIVTFSRYSPWRSTIVAPAGAAFTARCTVRKGEAALPLWLSLPLGETYSAPLGMGYAVSNSATFGTGTRPGAGFCVGASGVVGVAGGGVGCAGGA